MFEENSLFNELLSNCYALEEQYSSSLAINMNNNQGLNLFYAALNKAECPYEEISDSFTTLKQIAAELDIKSQQEIICALSKGEVKPEFKQDENNFVWVAKLFKSMAAEYIKPVAKPILKVKIQNQWHGANLHHFGIIKEILEETHTIRVTEEDDYDLVIDGVFGVKEITNKNAYKIFYTGEVTKPKIQGYNLSLGFDFLEENNNYLRLPLYYLYYGDFINADYKRAEECNPNKPYFACFLVSNPNRGDGAIARNEVFTLLSSYKNVTSGGPHLNNIGRIIPEDETFQFLSQCKFVLAYENHLNYPGYITEKLFQAYFAGSVPIYSNNAASLQDINQNAIILEQKFNSRYEMLEHIKLLDQDSRQYCKIWNQPIISNPEKNYEEMKEKIKAKMKSFLQERV